MHRTAAQQQAAAQVQTPKLPEGTLSLQIRKTMVWRILGRLMMFSTRKRCKKQFFRVFAPMFCLTVFAPYSLPSAAVCSLLFSSTLRTGLGGVSPEIPSRAPGWLSPRCFLPRLLFYLTACVHVGLEKVVGQSSDGHRTIVGQSIKC